MSQQGTNPNPVAPVPKVGERAPTLGMAVKFPKDKPVLVVFLRHLSCPFAEKTFRLLTDLSNHHPEIHCVAVSECSKEDTDKWIVQAGGEWEVQVLIDEPCDLYHAWGLGTSTTWAEYNPVTMWHTWKLKTDENLWGRNAGSGSQWQIGGAFAVDAGGFVRWSKPAATADEVPDFKEALKALEGHWGMPS
ncbi:hypothetical protein N0V88_001919 [Collariella sp. IMI 366227]|nr:hypothetical protein N0V88_001919 [Collariella sp. IMI 366227]